MAEQEQRATFDVASDPVITFCFGEIISSKMQDLIIRRDRFATQQPPCSTNLDVPMNTQGQIRCSSKGLALVAISGIGQPCKQE